MKSKGEDIKAYKKVAKDIGAPEAIIFDVEGEKISNSIRKFCRDIGITLMALEEGTPWANKIELYIVLIQDSV